jgi:phosphopantothenoylcysteine decarboxylase / phosphopantothenate---cysteine ligase
MALHGKKILLAVTGSIAAYKAAILVRLLIKQGAEVQVIMTSTAQAFISSLTLSVLSKRPVYHEVAGAEGWNNHVEMGLWADAMVVAPATAATLSRMASGLSEDLVTATYLSARCPVFVAPAMDLDMWHHPATKNNIHILSTHKVGLIPVGNGELASGLVGEGRMAEPEEIVAFLEEKLTSDNILAGKKILITAGPTFEELDPVRFIGNHSTGKMGCAIASYALELGAKVTLIFGPGTAKPPDGIHLIRVKSAIEMEKEALAHFENADIIIYSAAVADYRPETPSLQKIKKKGDESISLTLIKNPDIAAVSSKLKTKNQVTVGFALETNNLVEHASEKVRKKNFDFIVANSLEDKGSGFGHDTNKVTFVWSDNKTKEFGLKSKSEVAKDILIEAASILQTKLD